MEVASIYTQFHRSLLSFIRSKIRLKEDAEDILQNIYIKIAMNVDKLSDDEKIRSWIFAITRNAIIDYYRTNASRTKISSEKEISDDAGDSVERDPTKGLDQCMAAMISLLPEDYREIIIASELIGVSQKELAQMHRMAYPSMRSRVQRGRERLKQLFYNCCHIQTDSRGNVLEVKGKNACDGPCQSCGIDEN